MGMEGDLVTIEPHSVKSLPGSVVFLYLLQVVAFLLAGCCKI